MLKRFSSQFLSARNKPEFWVHAVLWILLLLWSAHTLHGFLALKKHHDTSSQSTLLSTTPASASTNIQSPAVNVSLMQSWNLFGDDAPVESKSSEIKVDTLQQTTLALKLLGLMMDHDQKNSSALIAYNNESKSYFEGDALPLGKDVLLEKVMSDRVVIDNRGTHETLFLYEVDKHIQVNDFRNDKQFKVEASYLRSQFILANNSVLAKAIRISEVRDEEGRLYGARLQSGSDKEIFARFGLQDGDILTVFDGTRLAEEDKLGKLIEDFRTASEAEFQIERGGQLIVLKIGFLDE